MTAESCTKPCDHCRPDDWHDRVLPAGHDGWHTCQVTA